MTTPEETLHEEPSHRRLIIIVVEPGEDPVIELDPPESFVLWELKAVLNKCVEMAEDDEIMDKIDRMNEEDDE